MLAIYGNRKTWGEFANHKAISSNIACNFYFARPYRSCDRGLNEHMNGQTRKYLPKGTNFDTIPVELIQQIEHALNSRPRKSLNYRTLNEVVNKYLQVFCIFLIKQCSIIIFRPLLIVSRMKCTIKKALSILPRAFLYHFLTSILIHAVHTTHTAHTTTTRHSWSVIFR